MRVLREDLAFDGVVVTGGELRSNSDAVLQNTSSATFNDITSTFDPDATGLVIQETSTLEHPKGGTVHSWYRLST